MFCVYLIQHDRTKEIYIGKTNNIKRRLKEHNTGKQKSTKRKTGQWILVYLEVFRSKADADNRESALKQHGSNKRWLKQRISNSLIQD